MTEVGNEEDDTRLLKDEVNTELNTVDDEEEIIDLDEDNTNTEKEGKNCC